MEVAEPVVMLTKAEAALMSDEEFFAAYRAGRVPRPDDCLTEENWEEVSWPFCFHTFKLILINQSCCSKSSRSRCS